MGGFALFGAAATMHLFTPRALVFSAIASAALVGAAAADPAPITYAGDGATSLAGGAANSYGYGAQAGRRQGAVIDIRRAAATPARAEAPAAPAATEQGARPDWLEQERVGPPYQANGRWYVPTPEPGYEQSGMASWYGPQFHGQRTANGEVFDQEGMTAAHPTLPLNSLVQVTNLDNGREVIVRVTDRGPFVGERLIDLSHGAAVALGFERAGHAHVDVRYLGPAPRRVNADGTSAPAPSPAPAQSDGPASLLPPSSAPPAQAEPPPAPSVQSVAYTPAAPLSAGGYFVQVGAFSDLSNADRVRETAAAAGPVVVDIRQTGNGELYRVRVGPWNSREEAEAAQRSLAGLCYGQTVVTPR
jgi:peptidoglycan lytic transglycosylase